MKTNQQTSDTNNYQRIECAINYIRRNFKQQPSLEEVASAVNLSPSHFQRLFSEWAGVSPKKFIQYLSIHHAKLLLTEYQATLFDAAYETGFSGTGRLHDLFINIEGMTPGQYKNGGDNLNINYRFSNTPFGKVIVASTNKGVAHLSFEEDEANAVTHLKLCFPNARFQQISDTHQEKALAIFQKDWKQLEPIKLHMKGTEFQLKVWEALLKLPLGSLTTYGDIATNISQPNASRAVGTAIGKNPIAFLIPCHRVIQKSGNLGGYRWGTTRKSAIIAWETALSS